MVEIQVDASCPRVDSLRDQSIWCGNVIACGGGSEPIAGFVVLVEDGALCALEAYSFGGEEVVWENLDLGKLYLDESIQSAASALSDASKEG